jgi:hypothetical protein
LRRGAEATYRTMRDGAAELPADRRLYDPT